MRTHHCVTPLAIICLVALSAWAAPDAAACSFVGPSAFETDSAATPSGTLSAPTVKVLGINRGDDEGTSCSDLGTVDLKVEPLAADVGYRFKVVGGQAPANILSGLESGAWQPPEPSGVFTFTWGDGAEEEQEAFSFDLEITPVDRSGATGPATVVTIAHGGVEATGLCAFTGASRHVPAPAGALVFGALMVWGWRRRT